MSTTPPFSSRELRVVRRNRWILGLAASPALLVIAAIVAGFTVKAAFFGFVLHPLIIAIAATVYAWRRNPWSKIEPREVRADASGVFIGDVHVPRASIREGFVLPGDSPKVLLRRRRALPIELVVHRTDEGRALLRALGLDASQTVARFRTRSRMVAKRRYTAATLGAFFAGYGVFLANVAGRYGPPSPVAGLVFAVSILAVLVLLLVPTWVSVGADGVVVSWFGRKRFIAYSDVELVTRYEKGWGRSRYVGVSLALGSGEEVSIPTGQARWDDQSAVILEERLREAMETHKTGGAAADAAMLRRGDRAVGDWVSALRAIGSGANADMRTAPLARERLLRIVEDATSAAPDRAAAAVALGGDLDDETRARLRSAAEATAAPKLRIAIEAAASTSEQAELEAALGEVEAQTHRARA